MTKTLAHIILFPFSLLYGLVVQIRNFLYDKKWLKSEKIDIPSICIGNLTVGGTGKTPHTEFVLSILHAEWKTAMLSRGYKRKTKGFQLANEFSDASEIGDEPFQIHRKFPKTLVAVDEKRVRGANELLKKFPDLDVIVLDDALQHRQIQTGCSILLTDYSRLYTRDFYLPAGRLRESKRGSKRADTIVVTKCPKNISAEEMLAIRSEINPRENQSLFFSAYEYQNLKPVFPETTNKTVELASETGILILAGIVSPQAIAEHLRQYTAHIDTLFFPDHHNFSQKNIAFLF